MKDMNLLNSEDIEVNARKKYKSYRIVEKRLFPFVEEPVAVEFAEEPVAVEAAKAVCDGDVTPADPNRLLGQFRSRLEKEALLRSLLYALVVGFCAMFVCALAVWILNDKMFWLSFIAFAVATGVALPLFYFARFKPSAQYVASRMDRLGLEERMITMNELKANGSAIAGIQRADAVAKMATVSASQLTIRISKLALILPCVALVLGSVMSTVAGLSSAGLIKSGGEIIEDVIFGPPIVFELEYIESEGGIIEGECFQVVEENGDGMPVMAIAMEDYIFLGWTDGSTDPYREDLGVKGPVSVVAVFMPAGNMPGMGGDGPAGDSDEKRPGQGESESDGQGDGESESDQSTTAAGGKYQPSNQVIDGKTFYGDVFDDAYEEVIKRLSEDDEMPQYLKDMILRYFNTLKN